MDSGSEIDFNDIPEYDSGIFTAFFKHFYIYVIFKKYKNYW